MPITVTLGLTDPDGRVNMTPMWFDHDGDKVLVNTAAHRAKCGWTRKNPRLTMPLVNPQNSYHWMSIKCTVVNEIREGEPGGEHIDRLWTKYTGQEPPYGLRGPVIDEKRVLFECRVDRVATFGKPWSSRPDVGTSSRATSTIPATGSRTSRCRRGPGKPRSVGPRGRVQVHDCPSSMERGMKVGYEQQTR